MENNELNLKPCPFCGREPRMEITADWVPEYYVTCTDPTMKCPACVDGKEGDETEEIAALRWNLRTGEKTPHGECSKCEAGFGDEEVKCMWLYCGECGRPEGPYDELPIGVGANAYKKGE